MYPTPIWNPFMAGCIHQKIRFEQMETSVWGNGFLVAVWKISHILISFFPPPRLRRRWALSKNSVVVSISNEACKPSKQFVVTAGSDMESMNKGGPVEEREAGGQKEERQEKNMVG